MKKRIFFILASFTIIIALLATFTLGCDEPPTNGTTPSPYTQLQGKVTTLEAKVAGLESAIASLNIPAGLEASVNSLTTKVTNVESSLSNLQSDLGQLPSSITINAIQADIAALVEGTNLTDTDLEAVETQVTDILVQINELENDLATLQTQIDELNGSNPNSGFDPGYLEEDIADLQAVLVDIEDTLEDIDLELDDLWHALAIQQIELGNIRTALDNVDGVIISKFLTGSNYLEFTTKVSGSYVVVLTLYGTGLNNIFLYIPPSQNIELANGYDYCYGATSNMRILILQPKTVVGTPPILPNWIANKIVEIDFTGSGFRVDYATIEIGAR